MISSFILFLLIFSISFLYLISWIYNIPRRRAVENKKTYFIDMAGSTLRFMPRITCLICNKTSYHPMDVQHKYCGNCNKFHKD